MTRNDGYVSPDTLQRDIPVHAYGRLCEPVSDCDGILCLDHLRVVELMVNHGCLVFPLNFLADGLSRNKNSNWMATPNTFLVYFYNNPKRATNPQQHKHYRETIPKQLFIACETSKPAGLISVQSCSCHGIFQSALHVQSVERKSSPIVHLNPLIIDNARFEP